MKKDKDKILDLIEENLFKNGFRNVSIDSIASSIKVSKKTIYKKFCSKEELITAIINRITECISNDLEKIVKEKIHPVEKIVEISRLMNIIGEKFSEKTIEEVRIHYPNIWKRIEEFRKEMFDKNISKIFYEGIEKGFIIDIPPQIIFLIHQSAIQSIINTEFILHNNYSLENVFQFTNRLLLNGLLTDKGRKKLKEISKKRNLEIKIS
ncbi:MAG: TetR/AcrR family transcriptional regulator [Melioribacteraceae bacterium]